MVNKELKEKGKIVADLIKQSFLSNMELMSPYKRSHFAIRLFRVSGSSAANYHIRKNFDEMGENLIADIMHHDDNHHTADRGEVFFVMLAKNNDRKGMERQKVFENRKKDLFHLGLIERAHIWNTMCFFKGEHSDNHLRWIDYLKNKDIKSIIFADDVFRHYSTQLITHVYHLKSNKVIDLVSDFKHKFMEVFGDESEMDDYTYMNKIYTLTHFIIAATDYYQKMASADEYKWILDYFSQNMGEILSRTNADIVGEVGLCFRLCGINEGEEIDSVTEYLLKEFDAEKGYIPRLSGDHQSSEHANSIAYMFLKGFDKLHPGPFFD